MHPILFDFGRFHIYSYGVLLAAAYLLGLRLALLRARARGFAPQRILNLGIWIIVCALVGAKLLLLIVDFKQFTASPGELLGLLRSGGVFYGGLIAGVAAGLWYVVRHGLPLWATTDLFAPGIALGHVVGRMGCLMAGCCFGRPSSVAWAIAVTDSAAAANVGTPLGVPLHPTQLYDAGAEAMILAGLLALERHGRAFPGRTFGTYLLLYGVSRFIIEFFRGDNRGVVFGTLSTSQFVSAILIPLAVVMLLLLRRQGDSTRHAASQRAVA